jgi:nicotinamidase-related amidase
MKNKNMEFNPQKLPGKRALLVIDMLKIYIYGKKPLLAAEKRPALIQNVLRAIEWAKINKIPIIYVNSDFTNEPILKVIGYREQSLNASEMIPELLPRKNDFALTKRGYDAFWKSSLEVLLNQLKIREIFICGVQTDCCVRETGVTAAHLGYTVNILKDCCETNRPYGQKAALRFMRTCVGKIITTEDLS